MGEHMKDELPKEPRKLTSGDLQKPPEDPPTPPTFTTSGFFPDDSTRQAYEDLLAAEYFQQPSNLVLGYPGVSFVPAPYPTPSYPILPPVITPYPAYPPGYTPR